MSTVFILLGIYFIGSIIAFFLILHDESEYKNEMTLSEFLEYLLISLASWFVVWIWIREEYKLGEKTKNFLNNTKIDISGFKKKR